MTNKYGPRDLIEDKRVDPERPDKRSAFDEQAVCRECSRYECIHWKQYFKYWNEYDKAMPPITASDDEHRKAEESWRRLSNEQVHL